MPQEHVDIVERILDGWGAGDFAITGDHLDPHVVYVVAEAFPEPGVALGIVGIAEYMRRFLMQWDHYAIGTKSIREVGDTVLADVVQQGRGRASGADSEIPSFVLFTFRGRKIVRMEIVKDERDALAAVGLQA